MSSAKPSLKYSFSLSPLRLENGSTAIEGGLETAAAAACFSACFTSAMLWNRCAGCFARHPATTRATSGGASVSGGGSMCRIAPRIEIAFSPRNAFRALSISYKTTPKEKMSERASTLLPWACSGDM